MDKEQARHTIKDLIAHQIPVHPSQARMLYESAGWELPKHLEYVQPIVPIEVSQAFLNVYGVK